MKKQLIPTKAKIQKIQCIWCGVLYVCQCTHFICVVQVIRIAGGVRRNDTVMSQLSLFVLAIAWSSLYRGSGSGVSRKAGGRRSSVSPRTDSSADFPKIFLAVKAFAIRLYCKNAWNVCRVYVEKERKR